MVSSGIKIYYSPNVIIGLWSCISYLRIDLGLQLLIYDLREQKSFPLPQISLMLFASLILISKMF